MKARGVVAIRDDFPDSGRLDVVKQPSHGFGFDPDLSHSLPYCYTLILSNIGAPILICMNGTTTVYGTFASHDSLPTQSLTFELVMHVAVSSSLLSRVDVVVSVRFVVSAAQQ